MLIEQRSILLGRFSRTIFDKRAKKADCREQRRKVMMVEEEETFESRHDSKSYLREVKGKSRFHGSKGWKRCEVVKKEKKYTRSLRWSNFSQWWTMGIWTKNGEKAFPNWKVEGTKWQKNRYTLTKRMEQKVAMGRSVLEEGSRTWQGSREGFVGFDSREQTGGTKSIQEGRKRERSSFFRRKSFDVW